MIRPNDNGVVLLPNTTFPFMVSHFLWLPLSVSPCGPLRVHTQRHSLHKKTTGTIWPETRLWNCLVMFWLWFELYLKDTTTWQNSYQTLFLTDLMWVWCAFGVGYLWVWYVFDTAEIRCWYEDGVKLSILKSEEDIISSCAGSVIKLKE